MLQKSVFRVSVLFTIILVALLIVLPASAGNSAQPARAATPYELINAVNALRASHGLPAYSISSILMYTAQSHADYMAAIGDVTHTGAGGSSVTDRLLAAGYPLAGDLSLGGFRSENITGGAESKTAQEAINGWTGDAPHLTTMVSPNLMEIGAGVAVANGRVYYVIDCALPTTNVASAGSTQIPGEASAVLPGEDAIPIVVLSTPNAAGEVVHEVLPGQTLWQIAIAYNVKIVDIRDLNGLLGDSIYPGDTLLISIDQPAATEILKATPIEDLTATFTPSVTTTSIPPTVQSISTPAVSGTVSAETSSAMSYVIGLVALAVLAGGYFAWLGNSKADSA
jgi:LysM repeat protein